MKIQTFQNDLVRLDFFRNMFGNLSKKLIANLAFPLARDNLTEFVSNLTSNTINKF